MQPTPSRRRSSATQRRADARGVGDQLIGLGGVLPELPIPISLLSIHFVHERAWVATSRLVVSSAQCAHNTSPLQGVGDRRTHSCEYTGHLRGSLFRYELRWE